MTSPSRIIDLSHPLSEQTPAFPGDPPLVVRILDSTAAPGAAGQRHLNSSHLSMGVHCGTHMDAPFHFFGDGATIDRVDLDGCMGSALLVRLVGELEGGVIETKHLRRFEKPLRDCQRVVLNTGWHHRWGENDYFTAHPVIAGEAARFLADCDVRLVGVDTPSVDRPPFDAHLALLGAGVLILENLTNLDAIRTDQFELMAIPLAIAGRDGSPVRALAIV